MTRISLPEMRKARYDDGCSTASFAAGGTLGILIPPSITLIICGAIAEESLPRLCATSLLPGIVLLSLYVAAALVLANARTGMVPSDIVATIRERVVTALRPGRFVVLFVVTIGGICGGIFNPNEAAGVGIIVVIVVGLSLITPPLGMNIFIIRAHAPDVRPGQLYRGIVPFLAAPIILIIPLFGFPQIALWLPDLLY